MIVNLGKQKRLEHIIKVGHKSFIVPVDDLLIMGVSGQLIQYKETIPLLKDPAIDAVLGFPGVFSQFYTDLRKKPWIINLTTSTSLSFHTYKRLSITLQNAISSGCDAVAAHVNLSSPNEGEMIQNLAYVSCECQKYGIPLMAIMYPRKPDKDGKDNNYLQMKIDDNEMYTKMVSHACRIAVELGVDIIKTNYTGSLESFKRVVYSSGNIPVIIAGGEQIDEEAALNNIRGAIIAGAAGICFGRNFFYRTNIPAFIRKIRIILDGNE
jgi:DhnA family fructose-bisphosphate aldolase class Ia